MDISSFISELLYRHNCVIIPGFGGFVCNYQPSEIHPVLNTISPPSKTITFNSNLTVSDGLLANYIAEQKAISFDTATALVNGWVSASLALLDSRDTLTLSKIGEFKLNIEGNIVFTPFTNYNYLLTSYGLKNINALPVEHSKEVLFTQPVVQPVKKQSQNRQRGFAWRIAAAVFALVAITAVLQLMIRQIEIAPLNLNEANLFSFLNNVSKPESAEVTPVKVNIAPNTTEVAPAIENVSPTVQGVSYYIIVGAFSKAKNIEAARQQLLAENPSVEILEETIGTLTRVGYRVNGDSQKAHEQLNAAREKNSDYWLFTKP